MLQIGSEPILPQESGEHGEVARVPEGQRMPSSDSNLALGDAQLGVLTRTGLLLFKPISS